MSYRNPILTKNFDAGGAINQCTIVKFGVADETVVKAAAATDLLIGIVDIAQTEAGNSVATGDPTDVMLAGIAEVEAGGTIARGEWVTSDADGHAIKATPAADTNMQVIGKAMASASDGDIVPVMIMPGQIQGVPA